MAQYKVTYKSGNVQIQNLPQSTVTALRGIGAKVEPYTPTSSQAPKVTKKVESIIETVKSNKVKLSPLVSSHIKAIERGLIIVPSWFNNNIAWVKSGVISERDFLIALDEVKEISKEQEAIEMQNISSPVNIEPIIVKKPDDKARIKVKQDDIITPFGIIPKESLKPYTPSQNMQKPNQQNCGMWDLECKFEEGVKFISETFEKTGEDVNLFLENEGKKQEKAWQDYDNTIKNLQSSAEQFGSDVIENVTDIGKGAEDFVENVGTEFGKATQSTAEFFGDIGKGAEDFVENIAKGGAKIIDDVTSGAEDLGKGFGDFNRNILIVGGLGVGALLLIGMKK